MKLQDTCMMRIISRKNINERKELVSHILNTTPDYDVYTICDHMQRESYNMKMEYIWPPLSCTQCKKYIWKKHQYLGCKARTCFAYPICEECCHVHNLHVHLINITVHTTCLHACYATYYSKHKCKDSCNIRCASCDTLYCSSFALMTDDNICVYCVRRNEMISA